MAREADFASEQQIALIAADIPFTAVSSPAGQECPR